MTYRITRTTDNNHIGEVFPTVQVGNVLTFADGDVVAIDQVFVNDDGSQVIAANPNYQITFVKE